MSISQLFNLETQGILESLYMTLVSTGVSYLIGIPLGVVLCITGEGGIRPNRAVNGVLGTLTNLLRSVPFLILLVTIQPVTRAIVGTTLGPTAVIVPLVFSAAPYVGRLVESSLKEVDRGVIEAAQSMGSTTFQIVAKVMLPEARPALLVGATIATTTVLGYSAMAGFVGGGGLGAIATNYGYYRYEDEVMLVTVVLLVLVTQLLQELGMTIATKSDRRIRK